MQEATFVLRQVKVTQEMIENYLEHHFEPKLDDNFKTEG